MFRRIASFAALAVIIPLWVQGETPNPFPDFAAKRVRPPEAGTRDFITIQIEEPQETPEERDPGAIGDGADLLDDGGLDQPVGRYGWFWDQISPELAATGPGRLDKALTVLAGGSTVAAPRLQVMHEIIEEQGVAILLASIETKVSPALILAVIAVESGGRADAVSSAGAQGLMQLMPDTAARFDVTDALVPKHNIKGGAQYLDWLLETFEDDPILALAGYNAGEGNVRVHQGVPPFAETRNYVPLVLAAFQVAKGLCVTPPQLISDGCVFQTMD